VDFLLECVGFPPLTDHDELIERSREAGDAVAWRGPGGEHLRLRLAEGIELRLDREEGQDIISLLPYYAERARLRIGVKDVRVIADSAFDALLSGWVAPPVEGVAQAWGPPGAYLLTTWLTDARRLPARLGLGHVLAISTAGFALDVTYLGPNDGGERPEVLELPRGACIAPLGGIRNPGGCSDVSARIKEVRHTRNEVSGELVDILEIDAPERALHLFISPWQLERDGLPAPRPGYRIEGTFLFTGRIAGGLPGVSRRARRNFG